MRGDRMPARVLAMRLIPRVDAGLRDRLGLGAEVHALGLITCDSDDVGYTALDEATKKACVSVAYAQSMYAARPTPTRLWQENFWASWPERRLPRWKAAF